VDLIRFNFDLPKAIQAMAYFILRLGGVEKVKLMKLIYIADKQSFLDDGHPITGDRLCAMRWGPVPSDCLRAVNGELWPKPDEAFEYLHVDDNFVSVKKDPGMQLVSASERATLDSVFAIHSAKDKWKLVGETHRFPEYVEAYVEGTSKLISYESLLRHSGRADLFLLGRPVVSLDTLAHMVRPFPASETDL
jgi:uncharacterized phage-associated protein